MAPRIIRNAGAIKLKAWRKQNKLSQFDCGEYFGIHPQQISEYETGRTTPCLETACIIHDFTDKYVKPWNWLEEKASARARKEILRRG